MKRTFFIIMLTVITSLTIIGCTEDAIQPSIVDDPCPGCSAGGGKGSTGEL